MYFQHFGMVGTCNIVGLKDKIFHTCMGIAENLLGFMVFCRGSLKLRYFLGIVLICSVCSHVHSMRV